nr:MAG TPA: hypothetical protein [Caudoviricetes sp.]
MADYIERKAAVKIAEKYGLANGSVLGRHTGLADCIASEIASLPAADVAPVVRCRDCAHLFGTLCAVCGLLPRQPDDFCSRGERKDGADHDT